MPKPATTPTTFQEFISSAVAKISDPGIQQQFTQTFGGLLENLPSEAISVLDTETSRNVMFHRDYSRLVNDHRSEAAQLQQQAADLAAREQYLQQLQANSISRADYEFLQQQLTQVRQQADWVGTIREKLEAMDMLELVLDPDELSEFRTLGESVMPEPATPTNPNQPVTPPAPQWINGQWYIPAAAAPTAPAPAVPPVPQQFAPASAPTPAAPPVDIQALIEAKLNEILAPAMAQVYGAASQTSLEVQRFANEWQALKGETIDPTVLNREFIASGKQFDQFLEEKYNLSEAREARRQADFEAAVTAKATEVAAQKIAELTAAGSTRLGVPAPNGSTPLFDALAAKPNGLRQAWSQTQPSSNTPGQPPTPQAAPAATPQQLPATPPPNPTEQGGVTAAAQALAAGTYANGRFDPTRPLGVPGQV